MNKYDNIIFAHQGRATDNTITRDGHTIDRSFRAFASKADFDAEQERVWQSSDRTQNLILSTNEEAKRHMSAARLADLVNAATGRSVAYEVVNAGKSEGIFPTREEAEQWAIRERIEGADRDYTYRVQETAKAPNAQCSFYDLG